MNDKKLMDKIPPQVMGYISNLKEKGYSFADVMRAVDKVYRPGIGSRFDDWLKDEGIYGEVDMRARRRANDV